MVVSGVHKGWIHPHWDQKCNLLIYIFQQCFQEEHTCSHHADSPEMSYRWEQLLSVLWTVRWSSPTEQLYPQGLSNNWSCIWWDKDGKPFLPGIGRGKHILSSETVTLTQFLPLPLEIKLTHTYLPCARPFMQHMDDDICCGNSKPPMGIQVKCVTVATQTSHIWMWPSKHLRWSCPPPFI